MAPGSMLTVASNSMLTWPVNTPSDGTDTSGRVVSTMVKVWRAVAEEGPV